MNRADRAVRLLSLTVAPPRQARFAEEWLSDLAAARTLGLSPAEIVGAATRVAAFLLWTRLRRAIARQRSRGALLAVGAALGLVAVIVDVRLQALVPFVVLVVAGRTWRCVRAWIGGAP